MPLDDLMSSHVYFVGNEPLKVLARISAICVSYHLLPSYILCPLVRVTAFSHLLFGIESYRDAPLTMNISLNRHTSNDIWLQLSPRSSNNISSTSSPPVEFLYMADSTSTTKLHAFTRGDTTYTSDDLSIVISVFVPKSTEKGQTLPVLVRWHGGALINGGRVYEPWFPKW
jgi:hypothetical protein